jgi:uncharacterized repeat protein (TIGR03803 family)
MLYSFPSPYSVNGDLVFDKAGNLYGTSITGGLSNGNVCLGTCGIVFELSPGSNGSWTETTIYYFCSGGSTCPDGAGPLAGLTIDSLGNLYGTTQYGGNAACEFGCGVVFELSPPSVQGGAWSYTNLHTFCLGDTCADGLNPRYGPLRLDRAGNLYGTTEYGGTKGYGVVYELSPAVGGNWPETVLYNFCTQGSNGLCTDGAQPQSSVTFDRAGNLWGTTLFGGQYSTNTAEYGAGVIFKLTPGSNGWTEKVAYAFPRSGAEGGSPDAYVSFDPKGNLYTTFSGEYIANSIGGLLKLGVGGKVSTYFTVPYMDGGVLVDPKRQLVYFAEVYGGVFQINSALQATELASYQYPEGGLIEDSVGNLYGAANDGGDYTGGFVFEIMP